MDFNKKKECLLKFESECKKFKRKLNEIAILNLNYDEYEHDYDSEVLDSSTSEWNDFISDIRGFFQVNPDEISEQTIYDLLFGNVTMSTLERLQHTFHNMVVAVDIEKAKTMQKSVAERKMKNSKEVFIVHGHDSGLKNEVARFISDQGLKPIILHEQASAGRTIIEKIEHYSDVDFGIVLYTPDDIGSVNDGSGVLKLRARQNVVLEHGYLMGKLGRDRVCAIVKGDIEKPGDIGGMVYVTYDESGGWKLALAEEMRAAGYHIKL